MIFTDRIKKSGDFSRVYKNGSYYAGKYAVLYVLKDVSGGGALGVTAGRKTGKSVRRNRLKRLIKENYRQYEQYIRRGFMFVFVVRVRKDEHMPDYYEIRREMKHLFLRAGAFDQQKWESSQNKA